MSISTEPPPTIDVRICDTTLRDGSHAVAHQFTEEQVRSVVRGLDDARIPVVEVAHGDGLAGSSFNYGFSRTDELSLIATAVEQATYSKVAVLLLPGIGTAENLRQAADLGVKIARIATHSTEADIAIQHFGIARDLGLETVGFLMLSHMLDPDGLAKQARTMANAGCQCVYVVDSAGALLMNEASERVQALITELGADAQVGYHGHNNLALGVANSIVAIEAGARQVDGALRALGAGSGNAPTEILTAVLDRLGVRTGVDMARVADLAEDVVRPMLTREPVADRNAITMGYAGVYSSFLLHAERAAERYGVPAQEILRECGARGYVGGQEDMIIDVTVELAARHESREGVITR